ncbi:hypothetical protein M885DRAFT_618877 [Pelagophyceae sp. CCMP2097]|nr:hypothetical protein M885DRAFT_618877 [Pelagophyceae sp. CCMP2097]
MRLAIAAAAVVGVVCGARAAAAPEALETLRSGLAAVVSENGAARRASMVQSFEAVLSGGTANERGLVLRYYGALAEACLAGGPGAGFPFPWTQAGVSAAVSAFADELLPLRARRNGLALVNCAALTYTSISQEQQSAFDAGSFGPAQPKIVAKLASPAALSALVAIVEAVDRNAEHQDDDDDDDDDYDGDYDYDDEDVVDAYEERWRLRTFMSVREMALRTLFFIAFDFPPNKRAICADDASATTHDDDDDDGGGGGDTPAGLAMRGEAARVLSNGAHRSMHDSLESSAPCVRRMIRDFGAFPPLLDLVADSLLASPAVEDALLALSNMVNDDADAQAELAREAEAAAGLLAVVRHAESSRLAKQYSVAALGSIAFVDPRAVKALGVLEDLVRFLEEKSGGDAEAATAFETEVVKAAFTRSCGSVYAVGAYRCTIALAAPMGMSLQSTKVVDALSKAGARGAGAVLDYIRRRQAAQAAQAARRPKPPPKAAPPPQAARSYATAACMTAAALVLGLAWARLSLLTALRTAEEQSKRRAGKPLKTKAGVKQRGKPAGRPPVDARAADGEEEDAATEMQSSGAPQAAAAPATPAAHADDALCVVCLDEPKIVACVPCMHVCCCEACAAEVTTCPMCRAQVASRVRVFS